LKKHILVVLRFAFFLGIGIFFIWLFLKNLTPDQKNEIVKSLKIANYTYIIIAMLLGLLSHYVRALRWRILIEPLGYKPRKLNVYMAVLIAYLANLALPRLGEVSRCGILTQYEKIPFNKSFGTVITERIIDMIAFVLLFFIMIFTMSSKLSEYVTQKIYLPLQTKFNITDALESNLLWAFIGVTAITVIVFLFLRKRLINTKAYLKVNHMLTGFLAGIQSLLKIRQPILFFVYTVAIWVLYLLMAYVVFFSLQETSNLSIEAGLAILVFGSVGIMIVQGGIGIYPAIVAETLFLFSITSTTGYAMGWLIWSSQTIMILIAGVFSLLLLNTFNRKGNDKLQPDTTENIRSTDTAVGTK
jgi:glycosyltransferase 2 family protein